jgi:deoxyribodipyrimidine photo-lyase
LDEGEKHFRNCLLISIKQTMLLNGNGLQVVEQMQLLILEYLIQFLQGEKFDKEGLYVKKWVPELKKFQINLFINHGKWN